MTQQTNHKFSPEVRKRAVRMVLDHQTEHSLQWATITSIASKTMGPSAATPTGRETQMLNLFGPLPQSRARAGLLFTPAAGTFGSGSTRLGLSQKDGLPSRCWLVIRLRLKAIDAR